MIGSENTLGVFEKIILKLVPSHASNKAMMTLFDKIAKKCELTIGTFGHAGDGNKW